MGAGGGLLDSSPPRKKLRSVVRGSVSSCTALEGKEVGATAAGGGARDVMLVRKLSGAGAGRLRELSLSCRDTTDGGPTAMELGGDTLLLPAMVGWGPGMENKYTLKTDCNYL